MQSKPVFHPKFGPGLARLEPSLISAKKLQSFLPCTSFVTNHLSFADDMLKMERREKSHQDYTVGWICALPKEQTAARAMLDEIHPDLQNPARDENTYILGAIGKHNIAITCLPKGKVGTNEAAVAATEMMRTFSSIKIGLMVGIGGSGIPSKVRLGDVVVSTPTGTYPSVVQWDSGKEEEAFKRTGAMENPPRALLKVLTKLETIHETEGTRIPDYLDDMKKKWPKLALKYTWNETFIDPFTVSKQLKHSRNGSWIDWLMSLILFSWISWLVRKDSIHDSNGHDSAKTAHYALSEGKSMPRDVSVHYGLIASGNKVIKNATVRDNINKSLGGNVLCFEMEAAGLVNFPCLVVRGICDYADSTKRDDWQEYAAAVAAAFAKEFLGYMKPADIEVERPMKDLLAKFDDVSSTITTVKSKLDRTEDVQILSWLSPTDYSGQQADFFNKRQKGSGKWLIESDQFQEWTNSNGVLFCPGIPGAGKTILSSIVVNHLMTAYPGSGDLKVGIAYVYFNYKRQDEQKLERLLAILLRQLAQGQKSLPNFIKNLYNKRLERPQLSIDTMTKAISEVCKLYEKVFLVVDALDECKNLDGCRDRYINLLLQLNSNCNFNIFATSRHMPEISSTFQDKNCTMFEIFAHDDDVHRFLDTQISNSGKRLLMDNRIEIIKDVTTAVKGMFLLAQLHFETIKTKTSLSKMRKALKSLSKGAMAYDIAYEEAMMRIKGQDSDSRDLADHILTWITCARRPLTTLELQHALAVEIGQPKLDENNIPEDVTILSVCAGLVTIDTESKVIRLVHYTTQQYLQRTLKKWFSQIAVSGLENELVDAETNITKVCVTYISYDVFRSGSTSEAAALRKRLKANPLYHYAATWWADHARSSGTEDDPLVMDFFKSEGAVGACGEIVKINESGPILPLLNLADSTDAQLAAFFGLPMVLDRILTPSNIEHTSHSVYLTPLMIAALVGNLDAVKVLIQRKASLEVRDPKYLMTPLCMTASYGHSETAKILIEGGADLDAKSLSLFTPLVTALEYEHEEVALLLVEKGANIFEGGGEFNNPPLYLSSVRGYEKILALLVQKGANIEEQFEDGRTPLCIAAINEREGVIRMLLEMGANLEHRDITGRTPLLLAASTYLEEPTRILIEGGANIEATDNWGRTPLHIAAEAGQCNVLRLLIDKSANLQARDTWGRDPLSVAVFCGSKEGVEVLIRSGADLNSRGLDGRTPLSIAIDQRERSWDDFKDIVELLIKKGAVRGDQSSSS